MDYIDQNPIRTNILIIVLLLVTLAVRLFGINHGLPYVYQIDEKFVVNSAIGFGTGDLNPHLFHWPGTSLMYFIFFEYASFFVLGWLFGFFQSTADFAELFVLNPSVFYLIGRITITLMGTATVFLIYKLGERIYNKQVGLLSAIFYAFSCLAVGIDHFIFPDTPLTFFMVLTMLFLHKIITQGEINSYIWAGFIIGVTIATKYNGAALLIAFGLAHLFRVHSESKKCIFVFFDKRILVALIVVLAGFILFCPFSILDFSTFHRDILWQFSRVHSGSFGMDVENAKTYYLRQAMPNSLGIGLAILSVMGFFYAIIRHKKEDILIGLFVLFYFLYIGSWKVAVDKYLLPILPFLAVFAALFTFRIFSIMGKLTLHANRLLVLFVMLLIADPFARSIYSDYLLIHKDTRTEAKEWIEENIKSGAKIAIDAGNFDIAKMSPPLNDSKESLMRKYLHIDKEIPETWASSKQKIGEYLKIKMKYVKGRTYNLIHIVNNVDGKIHKEISLGEFMRNRVDYIVVSSYAYKVYQDPIYKSRYPDTAKFYNNFYSSLDNNCKLVKIFYPMSKKGPGPIIKIYKILYEKGDKNENHFS